MGIGALKGGNVIGRFPEWLAVVLQREADAGCRGKQTRAHDRRQDPFDSLSRIPLRVPGFPAAFRQDSGHLTQGPGSEVVLAPREGCWPRGRRVPTACL